MGGGDAKKGNDEPGKDVTALQLELMCEYDKVPVPANLQCSLLAKITANSQPNEDKRAPVTICAAIDRSGSMKANLPLLKDSIQFMIKQLRREDRLCLITFDHEVVIDLPMTYMDPVGKLMAEKAVKAIKDRGHTNLSGGLLAALQALYEIPSSQASLVESILLFSDGKANFGITDSCAISKATKSMLAQIGRQACVFTLGYGNEHDTDLLHAISDSGGGLFYYIENKDNIPDSFCDCLGGLLSVAAQNIHLTFSAPTNGITLSYPNTTFEKCMKEDGKSFKVTIPDIYYEEERCIPIRATLLSPKFIEENRLPVLTCVLEYFNVTQCLPFTTTKTVEVHCSTALEKPIPGSFVPDINVHMLRCEIAESLVNATKLADKGDIKAARDLLLHCKHSISTSTIQSTSLSKHLMETVLESLAGLDNETVYKQHGKPVMMHYSHSHGQQRSSSTPSKHGYLSQQCSLGLSSECTQMLNPYSNTVKKMLKVEYAKVRFTD